MIECECYCELGRGHVHAKWSPVSTAWYKMQPMIRINHEIATKQELVDIYKCCPMKVFDLKAKGSGNKKLNKIVDDIEDISQIDTILGG